MKASVLTVLATLIFSVSFSASAAPSTYDREYAYLALLDMGHYVSPEEIGEMFRDNIFILVNAKTCYHLDAVFYDDSGRSCLMQVQEDGSIWGFQGDNSNSLFE